MTSTSSCQRGMSASCKKSRAIPLVIVLCFFACVGALCAAAASSAHATSHAETSYQGGASPGSSEGSYFSQLKALLMHPVQFAERKFVQAASKQASEYVHKGVASFETLIRGAKAFEEAVDHLAKFDAGAASKYRGILVSVVQALEAINRTLFDNGILNITDTIAAKFGEL